MTYEKSDSCGDNLAFIIMTFVFIVLSLILGFCRMRDDATIFTSGLVNFWLSFLLWSALASKPDLYCNQLFTSGWTTFVQVGSWILFTFIMMLILSVTSKNEDGSTE